MSSTLLNIPWTKETLEKIVEKCQLGTAVDELLKGTRKTITQEARTIIIWVMTAELLSHLCEHRKEEFKTITGVSCIF